MPVFQKEAIRNVGSQAGVALIYMVAQILVAVVAVIAFGDTAAEGGGVYIASALLGFLFAAIVRGFRPLFRDALAKGRPMGLRAFLMLTMAIVGVQCLTQIGANIVENILSEFNLSLMPVMEAMEALMERSPSMYVYVILIGPVAEELVFRGAIMGALKKYGKWFAIVVSSVMFGLMHGNIAQMIFATMLGILLGYVAMTYSIKWAIIFHIINNFVLDQAFSRIETLLGEWGYAINGWILILALAGTLLLLIKKRRSVLAFVREKGQDAARFPWAFMSTRMILLIIVSVAAGLMNIYRIAP